MSPLELLEFITRHTAHKSMKYISVVAGTDAGNLHSCLAGKRAMPFTIAQRVAAAVGLKASLVNNQLAIGLASETVINLEVEGAELPLLSDTLRTLAGERSICWRVIHTMEKVNDGGIFAIAIACIEDCYILVNLSWASSQEAYHVLSNTLHGILPGVWLPQEPEQFTFSLASSEWIRLRAGVESIRTLDKMFMREHEAGIDEWAQLLIDLHRMGARPRVVSRFMRGIINSAKKSDPI